jgi:hypothetical protein
MIAIPSPRFSEISETSWRQQNVVRILQPLDHPSQYNDSQTGL